MGISSLKILSDSQVVVRQVNSEYAVNFDNLKKYAKKVNLLAVQFQYFILGKIGRDDNVAADKLAKIASGEASNDSGITVELVSHLAPFFPNQSIAFDFSSWVDELINFISYDIQPEDRDKAR